MNWGGRESTGVESGERGHLIEIQTNDRFQIGKEIRQWSGSMELWIEFHIQFCGRKMCCHSES